MVTQFDDKGKIFTTVITKKPIDVVIQTLTHRIIGKVFYRPDNRLIDELNTDNIFLAVTNAKILNDEGEILFTSDFLTININQIIWILPVEEIAQGSIE